MAIENTGYKVKLYHVFKSTMFSVVFLLVVFGILLGMALFVTDTYQKKPDFGGMLTIRQADLGLEYSAATSRRLTKLMIFEYITSKEVIEPIAKRNSWNIPYEDMVKHIEVKEKLASTSSFTIVANTGLAERSSKIARELAISFLNEYQHRWELAVKEVLAESGKRIEKMERDLDVLVKKKQEFMKDDNPSPLGSELELRTVNEQLINAQKQFLTAYGEYIVKMEGKRTEMQLEYDLLRQLRSDNDVMVINMRKQLAELDRQCARLRVELTKQKPELYRMTLEPHELKNLPNDILYFYDNIQTLQQIKLSLIIDSMIKEKKSALDKEYQKEKTLEKLIESKSCDVFIRGS